MLRTTASKVAQRSTLRFSRGAAGLAVPRADFHASSVRQEEEKTVEKAEPRMTPSWWDPTYTVPLAFSLAIPALHYDWITINEETQLAGVIMGFSAVMYSQAGDMIKQALTERGDQILKEQNEVEDAVIDTLETMADELKVSDTIVQDMNDINDLTDATYVKLNAAGEVKPLYDFKAQVERVLNAIQAEEANVTEKAKVALMAEATAVVTEQFTTSKELKKAAMDAAVAKIKGTAKAGAADPVQAAYVKFFQDKAAAASKVDDSAEAEAQRKELVAKLNAVARNEGFFFEFDEAGKPKMVV